MVEEVGIKYPIFIRWCEAGFFDEARRHRVAVTIAQDGREEKLLLRSRVRDISEAAFLGDSCGDNGAVFRQGIRATMWKDAFS